MKQVAGLSPVLYHRTNLRNAVGILNTNRFELIHSLGNDFEEKFGFSYYLSTARSMTSAYISLRTASVVFELDGVRLSHKYKGKAVDYYGPDHYKTSDGTGDMRAYKFEAEDRVYSNEPFIPAKPYVKRILCLLDEDDQIDVNNSQQLARRHYMLKVLSMKRKIPLSYFGTARHMISRDFSKALDFNPLRNPKLLGLTKLSPQKQEVYEWERTVRSRTRHRLSMWYTLAVMPRKPGVTPESQIRSLGIPMLTEIYQVLLSSDAKYQFKEAIQESKFVPYPSQTDPGEKRREHLDRLIAWMRKHGMTIDTFLQFLKDKWKP